MEEEEAVKDVDDNPTKCQVTTCNRLATHFL